jgi:Uma2 family endonuclease
MRLDSYSDDLRSVADHRTILSSTWRSAAIPTIAPPRPVESQVEVRLLSQLLWFWAEQPDAGFVLSRDKSFQLSTGQICAPIAAWIDRDRWQQLPPEQQMAETPICPNFVVELRRVGDSFHQLNQTMEAYLGEVGMQLGWLIDCEHQSLYIYRPNLPVLCLTHPELVTTAPILPGFVLDWRSLW